jgi:alkylation response protein AidB-like acyl-CoA dehydrogenase
MDFRPAELTRDLAGAVRAFVDGAVRPAAAAWDAAGRVAAPALREAAELGVFGLAAGEAVGGLDADTQAQVAVWEELAAGEPGLAMLAVQHAAAVAALQPGHADRGLLRELATGKQLATWAVVEDADHPDAAGTQTRAEHTPEGWRLHGRKVLVLGGDVAHLAVVTATVDGELSAFVVSLAAAGVRRTRLETALGLRGAGVAQVALDGALASVRLPVAVAGYLDLVRLGAAAVAVGAAREALRVAARYASEREQFGKPIATLQPIQWQIANSAVELDAARVLVQRAAWLVVRGRPAGRAIAMAKAASNEAACRITDRALQVHGGYGFTRDYPIEKLYRDAATLAVLHGAAPALKVAVARAT